MKSPKFVFAMIGMIALLSLTVEKTAVAYTLPDGKKIEAYVCVDRDGNTSGVGNFCFIGDGNCIANLCSSY